MIWKIQFGSKVGYFLLQELHFSKLNPYRQRLTRQRLTHFMKIIEIFKIRKFLEKLCQNPQF